MNKHFSILERIAEATDPVANHRLAAMLVYKNEVISVGTNKLKTHPLQKKFGKNSDAVFLHAEIDSIKNALYRYDIDFLKKCTLYILRLKKQKNDKGEYLRGLSKPCEGCLRALVHFGIKHVYYTTEDGIEKYW